MLVRAIDVSSHQPRDLTAIIAEHKPEHVVVKLYQSIEAIPQSYTRAQIDSARANACSVAGYVWLYASHDPRSQVRDVVALARDCGLELPILWLDIEPYTDGTIPSVGQIRAAVQECEMLGVRPGIYSGAWVFSAYYPGITEFGGLPLWAAHYNGVEDLDSVPLFGGWERDMLCGHQYSADTGIDLDVFRREIA